MCKTNWFSLRWSQMNVPLHSLHRICMCSVYPPQAYCNVCYIYLKLLSDLHTNMAKAEILTRKLLKVSA